MRLSILAYESCEYNSEKNMLEKALEINPDNETANYKYAVLLEYEGNVEKACFHYYKASKDPEFKSSEFKEFLNSEIKRIRKDGPKIRPKFSGLKYASY